MENNSPLCSIKVNNYDDNYNLDNLSKSIDNYEILEIENRIWDKHSELYTNKIFKQCKDLADSHKNESIKYKKLNFKWSLINLILPLLMAPITAILIDYPHLAYIEMTIFIILSVVNSYLIKVNFSKKQEKHMFSFIKYTDLLLDIEFQLLKPKMYRENVNLFCSKIKTKFSYLQRNSFII